MPPTKISILREHMAAGRWDKALALAAKFPSLGAEAEMITRAHAAITNRAFYIQLQQDPDALRSAGICALKRKYERRPGR